jgi:hypothetical protein
MVFLEACIVPAKWPASCEARSTSQGQKFNGIRWSKANFADVDGSIMTGNRRVAGWPLLASLRVDPCDHMPFGPAI